MKHPEFTLTAYHTRTCSSLSHWSKIIGFAACSVITTATLTISNVVVAHAQVRRPPVEAPVDPYESSPARNVEGTVQPTLPRVPPAPVGTFETPSERAEPSASPPKLSPTETPIEAPAGGTLEADCPSTEDIPFEYRRSWAFYLLTQDARVCSNAVQELRTLSQAFRDGTQNSDADSVLGDSAFLSDPKNVYARGIVERYVNSCSYSLGDARAISHLTTPETIQKIRRAIGIIRVGPSRCMATITNGMLLTARHCFGTATAGDLLPDTQAAVQFTSLDSALSFQIKTSLREAQLSPGARDEDWVALPLGEEAPSNILSLTFAPQLATRWQPLILISVSGYAQALANNNAISPDVIRIDISPKCVVQAREGHFIYHSCQTLRGMSGAPLLTMNGTELVVIGVHTGVSAGMGSACSSRLSSKYINYGVVPHSFSK